MNMVNKKYDKLLITNHNSNKEILQIYKSMPSNLLSNKIKKDPPNKIYTEIIAINLQMSKESQ